MISPSDYACNELVAGATRIGLRHIREQIPNQDAILCKRYEHGVIVAVADGVGSDEYSHVGSKAAVFAVHSAFEKLQMGLIDSTKIAESIMESYVTAIDKAYQAQAATTCIYMAFIYERGLYLGQVGDGICCGAINNENFVLQTKDDEFTNVVKPLSAVNCRSEWTEAFVPADKLNSINVMISTDGVSEDILPSKECDFTKFIIDKLHPISSEKRDKYLQSLLKNWSTPQSIDDKTFCFYSWKKGEN